MTENRNRGITMTVRFEDGVEVVFWGKAMIDFIRTLQREGYEVAAPEKRDETAPR